MSDLETPEHVAQLVRAFYARVAEDPLLGPVFIEQARVDWDTHRTKLTAFWCAVLFKMPGFRGTPTQKHRALSAQKPFRAEHFERWVNLFHSTVDHQWSGPNAEAAKRHAVGMAKAQSRMVETAERWYPKEDRA